MAKEVYCLDYAENISKYLPKSYMGVIFTYENNRMDTEGL